MVLLSEVNPVSLGVVPSVSAWERVVPKVVVSAACAVEVAYGEPVVYSPGSVVVP